MISNLRNRRAILTAGICLGLSGATILHAGEPFAKPTSASATAHAPRWAMPDNLLTTPREHEAPVDIDVFEGLHLRRTGTVVAAGSEPDAPVSVDASVLSRLARADQTGDDTPAALFLAPTEPSPVPSVADLVVQGDAYNATAPAASRRAAEPDLLDARTAYPTPGASQRGAESFAAGFASAFPAASASAVAAAGAEAFAPADRSVTLGSGVRITATGIFPGLATAASLPAPAVVPTNLVTNPGFETTNPSFAGYTVTPSNGNTVYQTTLSAHSGSLAADFSGETPGYYGTLTQNIATTSGTLYTVSFWVEAIYTDSTGGGFKASFGNTTLLNITNTSNFPYTLETYNVQATSSSTALTFGGYNVDGNYELDDLSVTVAVPEPATWAGGALLLGTAALTLRRRSRPQFAA